MIAILITGLCYGSFLGNFPFGYSLDYFNYLNIFSDISSADSPWDLRYEPLFFYITKGLILLFGHSKNYLYIFIAIISLSYISKKIAVLKLNGNLIIFFIIYFSWYSPILDQNQFRFSVALSFIYLSIIFINKNKFFVYIFTALAILSHYSSILFLIPILYYADRLFFLKFSILFLLIIYFFLDFINDYLLLSIMSNLKVLYDNQDISSNLNYFSYQHLLAIFSIFIIYKSKVHFRGGYIFCTTFGLFLFYLTVFLQIPYSFRLFEVLCSLIPLSIACVYKEKNLRFYVFFYTFLTLSYSFMNWRGLLLV